MLVQRALALLLVHEDDSCPLVKCVLTPFSQITSFSQNWNLSQSENWIIDCFLYIPARICEAVQTSGPVDPAGCVQMAEEALSHSAPDLQ